MQQFFFWIHICCFFVLFNVYLFYVVMSFEKRIHNGVNIISCMADQDNSFLENALKFF